MSTPPKPGSRQFEMKLEIDAPRDAVWSAITSDAELRRWFPPEAQVAPGPNGTIVWKWGEIAWPQQIEIWKPGSHLRTRYDASAKNPQGGSYPLFIDWHIEGTSGKTVVRLVHSGFGPDAAFDQEYDGIRRGWQVELQSLRVYLEHHAGHDREVTWCIANIPGTLEEGWKRLTAQDGLACGPQLESLRAGEPFRFKTADGDLFEGTALHCQSHEFSGLVRNWGNGFARLGAENCGGHPQIWLWLATYGESAARRAELESRWKKMLARLFPEM